MYGLRSSPKQWQDHIATVLTKLGLIRLKTDSNVYRNKEGTAYIMIYVDDLLLLGEGHIIDKIFEQIEKEVLLRPTGELQPGTTEGRLHTTGTAWTSACRTSTSTTSWLKQT